MEANTTKLKGNTLQMTVIEPKQRSEWPKWVGQQPSAVRCWQCWNFSQMKVVMCYKFSVPLSYSHTGRVCTQQGNGSQEAYKQLIFILKFRKKRGVSNVSQRVSHYGLSYMSHSPQGSSSYKFTWNVISTSLLYGLKGSRQADIKWGSKRSSPFLRRLYLALASGI